ncbi:hypothetical protein ABZ845_30840 [Streptomyces sp. NPDC047022]|uniref:hypothetical protein n=1 Tax=Streptomyces sp. NPDC047022 TaxID=3155737 RepID=UPI0033FC90DD
MSADAIETTEQDIEEHIEETAAEETAAEETIAEETADVDTRRARRARRRMLRAMPDAEPVMPDRVHQLVHDRRIRWATFNLSAAAAGHVALWSLTGDPMTVMHYMARAAVSVPEMTATGITGVCLVAGWKGARLVHLHRLPGVLGLLAPVGAAVGAACWGSGTVPAVGAGLEFLGSWGPLAAPILTAGPAAAACWWLLDRRAAGWFRPLRWVARIPLATIATAALIYTPGATR